MVNKNQNLKVSRKQKIGVVTDCHNSEKSYILL
jgi:hypothetical protein